MITQNELAKLKKLAKLEFTESESNIFIKKLNSVIEMIGTIKEVDCNNVEPLRSVSDSYQRMRQDEVLTGDISDQIFSNVPKQGSEIAKEVKCFVVPKVIE